MSTNTKHRKTEVNQLDGKNFVKVNVEIPIVAKSQKNSINSPQKSSNSKPLEIEYSNDPLSINFNDDNENYESFNEFLEDDTQRKKNSTANTIIEMGSQFLGEIENKSIINEKKKLKLIPYIIRKSDKYSEDVLISYSYSDVKSIYDEIKANNKSFFSKLFHFFINN
jgi:hypothetical protein